MKKNPEDLSLTLDEAIIFFGGFHNGNQTMLLRNLIDEYSSDDSPKNKYEIRFLFMCLKVMLSYRNKDVMETIQYETQYFLKKQFRGKYRIKSESFRYLFLILWQLRNCKTFDDETYALNFQVFRTKFRKKMIECGLPLQLELELEF